MRFLRWPATLIALGIYCGAAQTVPSRTQIDVVVTDESGTAIRNLSRNSFELFENGEPRELQGFYQPETPWSLLLMFDHSLTWLETDDSRLLADRDYVTSSWRAMGDSITRFLSHLGPQDRIAVAAFEDKVNLLLDFRSARSGKDSEVKINPVLQMPQAPRDLYGGIRWAIDKLKNEKGRKAVILFTDGRDGRLAPQWFTNEDRRDEIFDPLFGLVDEGEAREFLEMLEAARASGIRFCFIVVNASRVPDFRGRPVSRLYPGAREAIANYLSRVRLRIERVADVSDGTVVYGNNPADALAAYERFYSTLRLDSRYTLQFPSMKSADDTSSSVEVRVKQDGVRLYYSRTR